MLTNASDLVFVSTAFATTSRAHSNVFATLAMCWLQTATLALTMTSASAPPPSVITAPASTRWDPTGASATRDSKSDLMGTVLVRERDRVDHHCNSFYFYSCRLWYSDWYFLANFDSGVLNDSFYCRWKTTVETETLLQLCLRSSVFFGHFWSICLTFVWRAADSFHLFYLADINECQILLELCRNGRCRNTEGSFTCECADGYTVTSDGESCRDINECSEVPLLSDYLISYCIYFFLLLHLLIIKTEVSIKSFEFFTWFPIISLKYNNVVIEFHKPHSWHSLLFSTGTKYLSPSWSMPESYGVLHLRLPRRVAIISWWQALRWWVLIRLRGKILTNCLFWMKASFCSYDVNTFSYKLQKILFLTNWYNSHCLKCFIYSEQL